MSDLFLSPTIFGEGWVDAHDQQVQVEVRGSHTFPAPDGSSRAIIGVTPREDEVGLYIASHGRGAVNSDLRWKLSVRLTYQPERVRIEIWRQHNDGPPDFDRTFRQGDDRDVEGVPDA